VGSYITADTAARDRKTTYITQLKINIQPECEIQTTECRVQNWKMFKTECCSYS